MAHIAEEILSCRLLFYFVFTYFCYIGLPPVLTTDTGLYKDTDPMVQFTNDTIKKYLTGNDKVWIVEFYSSWCGHCQAFAPTWIRLALQLKNWNSFVNVGVIDCAAERNYKTCKDFEIDSYPTIRFFPVNWQEKPDKNAHGHTYKDTKDVESMRNGLMDYMEKQKGGVFRRNELPFRFFNGGDVQNYLYKKDFIPYRYLALLFDSTDSYLGKTLALDTMKSKKVVLKRASNDELKSKYNVVTIPSLILITISTGKFKELSPMNRTHSAYLNVLNQLAGGDVINALEDLHPPLVIDEKALQVVANISSEVHMQDITSAISFSLLREVGKINIINGDAMVALKDWVNLLAKCLPSGSFLQNFLRKLDKWLHDLGNEISSEKFVKYIEENQESNSYLPSEIKWHGCKGSAEKYRGFPCGLWTLFHSLTVSCSDDSGMTGYEILRRIRSFIDHYFGCRYCRDHFIEMSKDLQKEVKTQEEAIVWLWSRHNRVNARLERDISSDPFHRKVQFPPKSLCASCHNPISTKDTLIFSPTVVENNAKWSRKFVLEFLKDHYNLNKIQIKDNKKIIDGETQDSDAVRNRFTYKFYSRTASPPFSLLGMSRVDLSMCVVLYGSIIGAVFGLYVYFIRRKKQKTYKSYV
ncbi:sulfhydryl oxidase 1 isoform X1 [Hydra vulgaris]|uniref:Sulfhydryl oxidase n=1 Tax=Hydra vulgaris TaxID=6087 RepID=T2MJV0_HYDVU|nr:sulfhydryl oxidase 1 [Hydra vulgaris]